MVRNRNHECETLIDLQIKDFPKKKLIGMPF